MKKVSNSSSSKTQHIVTDVVKNNWTRNKNAPMWPMKLFRPHLTGFKSCYKLLSVLFLDHDRLKGSY